MSRILIADDEAYILRVISMWLSRNGHDVIEANDGREALEVLDRGRVDVIVSDMNMPHLDGLGLVKIIREERGLETPFLLLSARCDQTRLATLVEPYGVHLYAKPFVPSKLIADIDRLLGISSSFGMSNEG